MSFVASKFGAACLYGCLVISLWTGGPAAGGQGNAEATAIDLTEIRVFGDRYLGTIVKVYGLISQVAPCRAPGNTAFSCVDVRTRDGGGDTILVPSRVARSQLSEWGRAGTPVVIVGRVEVRTHIDNSKAPALVASSIREKPLHEATLAPLRPDWQRTKGPQVGDGIFYDANSVEKGSGEISAWVLINYGSLQDVGSGTALSSLHWLRFSCDGSKVASQRTAHYSQQYGRGQMRSQSDQEDLFDASNGPLTKRLIFANSVLSLQHLCS